MAAGGRGCGGCGDAYDTLLRQGYAYGPVFQGLKAAWRRGDDVFAEVELPEESWEEAGPVRAAPGTPGRRHACRDR